MPRLSRSRLLRTGTLHVLLAINDSVEDHDTWKVGYDAMPPTVAGAKFAPHWSLIAQPVSVGSVNEGHTEPVASPQTVGNTSHSKLAEPFVA